MPSDKVWDDFAELPSEAQRQVTDFIAFLRQRHQNPEAGRKTKNSDLSREPFVGMWRDREDLQKGTEWVRNLREREWTR